jgi:FkbM family methyltransferase
MNKNDKIKMWDEVYCGLHVGGLVNQVTTILSNNNISEINYIDIGANVGKVYDLLSNQMEVKNSWLIEASPTLYKYLEKKFKKQKKIKTYNYAVFNQNGFVDFDESSLEYQIKNQNEGFNLGLSSIGTYINPKRVESIKISDFSKDKKKILEKVNFIKIDTESVDFEILEDLLTVVDDFKNKPLIIFEINYFVRHHTKEWAQKLLNKFVKKGYKKINLDECSSDGILIPKNFK